MSVDTHAKLFSAPRLDPQGRIALVGLSLPELQEALAAHGMPAFRAKQVWHWMYHRGVGSFDKMSNLSAKDRELLAAHFTIDRPRVVTEQRSSDGTIKWLLAMADGQQIETVFIPENDRGTLCVSSQVGCTLTCRFCHTGTQPLVRNLGSH